MNYNIIADDHAGERLALTDSEEKASKQLAVELWKEIHMLSNNVASAVNSLPGKETFRRIIASLSQAGAAVVPQQADWTIAIDLTTDFDDDQGVHSRMKQLNEFAKKTKGTNITIVAQAAFADTDEFDWNGPVFRGDPKYRLERYVIKDGRVANVGKADSKGYGGDLTDLLAYVCKNHPSKRTALIIDSHGTGNEGLHGDTGKVSVDAFVKAVQEGLKGSGHEKLDMLDFDTCLMAANGAMSRIRHVADQVVASAESESIYDGQNYLDPIARLSDKPDADGLTLARDIVTQTHKDMELRTAKGWNPEIDTLAHLNLRQYDDFSKSLNLFGDHLVEALKHRDNKIVIESAIDSSQKYGSSGSLLISLFGKENAGKHRTDLKEFTEKILAAIDNGEIKDPNRILKHAAQDLLNKRSLLVDSYHGAGEYAKAGGISVFLPGRNLRNLEQEAALHTAAGRLSAMTDAKRFNEINKNETSRKDFLNNIKIELFLTRPHLYIFGTNGVDKELDNLDRLSNEFSKATDNKQRQLCLKQLHAATINLASTEPFKKQYQEQLTCLKDKVAKVYKVNNIDGSNGWSRFRLKLRDGK